MGWILCSSADSTRTTGRLGMLTCWVAIDKHSTVSDSRAVCQSAQPTEDIIVPLPLHREQGGLRGWLQGVLGPFTVGMSKAVRFMQPLLWW